jgi:hypothetical protein
MVRFHLGSLNLVVSPVKGILRCQPDDLAYIFGCE